MTLPGSPPISLKEIKSEFGGPGNLRSYLAGGAYVTAGSANGTNNPIPSSGLIDFFNLLGAGPFAGAVHTYTSAIAGNQTETVPYGASTVVIEVWGAGGGGNDQSNGGGGYSKSSYSCVGGETLLYEVGGSDGSVNLGVSKCSSGTMSITTLQANLGGSVETYAGGTASGGNITNTTGGNTPGNAVYNVNGGAGANGGAGGVSPTGNGTAPGGGGAGNLSSGGNGAGGQVRFTYT